MSIYRTYTRIKNQIKMFTEGFKTLMKPEWINMFSVPELQQLISGESSDIDLEDLKFVLVFFFIQLKYKNRICFCFLFLSCQI